MRNFKQWSISDDATKEERERETPLTRLMPLATPIERKTDYPDLPPYFYPASNCEVQILTRTAVFMTQAKSAGLI